MRCLVLLALAACASGVPGDEPDEPGVLGDGKGDSSCTGNADGLTIHLCNFHQVTPGLLRGARPSQAGMDDLAALGVRTDLDLERTQSYVDAEQGFADNAGVDFASEPMSYIWEPSDDFIDEVLSIMADPAMQPVYVHCKLGNDRTGLVVALYRVEVQGWTPKAAWDEMMAMGFHRIWVGLSHYFEERTGYED